LNAEITVVVERVAKETLAVRMENLFFLPVKVVGCTPITKSMGLV
jgi:hypothetical protein